MILSGASHTRNLVFFTFLFSIVFLIATFPISNFDIFWHLAFGKIQFLENRILTEEIFSHTRNGTEWYNHTWLSGLVFYNVYYIGGYKGLILFKAFIVSIIALLLSLILKKRGDSDLIILSLILLMTLSSLFRYLERPHIFTYLFIALTYYMLYRFIHYNESRIQLLLLPFIALIWANFHSGVIFGFIIVTVFIFGEVLKAIMIDRHISAVWNNSKIRYLYLILILFVVASFINPYGPAPYRGLLVFGGSGGLEIEGKTVNYMASMGVEFLPPSLDSFPLFWFTVALTLLFSIIYYRKIDITEFLLMFLFLVMALKYNRAIGMFNIVMVPYLASLTMACVEGKKSWDYMIYLFLVILFTFTLYIKFFEKGGSVRLNFGLNPYFVPLASSKFIKEKNISGKMFNTEAIGGYLEWIFYPDKKIFHDNRTNVFGSLYEEMHKPGMMEKYGVNYGIVMRSQFPPDILFPQNKWSLIFWDKCCSVYLRRNSQNRALISQYDIRYFRPGRDLNKMVSNAKRDRNIGQLIKEIEHHLAYVDNLDAFLALARLYEETEKNGKEYLKLLLRGLEKWPKEADIYLALANNYYRRGNNKLAKNYFKDVIMHGGADEFIYLNLGYIAYDEGNFKESINNFNKSRSYNKDFDQSYYGLGIAYEKNGDVNKAVKYLQEYVKKTSDSKWKSIAESKLMKLKSDEKK